MVASGRKEVSFIVLLAGPGVRIIDLMAEQNAAFLSVAGIGQPALEAFKPFYKKIIPLIIHAPDMNEAKKSAGAEMTSWVAKTDPKIIEALGFVSQTDQEEYIKEMVMSAYTPWMKYFMDFDPRPFLEKLRCRVLAINGDKDIQVISKQNLPGIEAALKKSRSAGYEIKEMPGLNHLFQDCKKCTSQEYGELEETFSPAALQVIGDWLLKNVK